MNPNTSQTAVLTSSAPDSVSGALGRQGVHPLEWLGFALLLVLCNAHLVDGKFPGVTALLPSRVMSGELWRMVSHAFTHVSWYHLAVDGAAFATLYTALDHWSLRQRLAAVGTCILGSAVAAMIDLRVNEIGLCGLSGCAHGLMVLVAIDAMRGSVRAQRLCGWVAFSAIILKCLIEASTQGAVFADLHPGSVGVPIVVCHAGGAVAALMFAIFWPRASR